MAEQVALERDAEMGFEHQRVQERLAELSVPDPRTVDPQQLERADVDEHRPATRELHVERVAVLHGDVFTECGEKDLQVEQCGVAQHLERPLVRVRDERDPFVFEDRRELTGRSAGDLVQLDGLGPDRLPLGQQRGEELRGRELRPVLGRGRVEASEDATVGVEHARRRVTKGARLEPGIGHRWVRETVALRVVGGSCRCVGGLGRCSRLRPCPRLR